MLVILAMVLLVEVASAVVRRRVLAGPGAAAAPARPEDERALAA